jgi:hypothetical protein
MSETNPPTTLTLEGLYNYKDALLDDSVPNGAAAYNEKFDEIVIKADNEWWFIESHDKTPVAETELFNKIKEVATNVPELNQKDALQQITFDYNVLTDNDSDEQKLFVARVAVAQTAVKAEPKATKEEYMENENFGEF